MHRQNDLGLPRRVQICVKHICSEVCSENNICLNIILI